MRCLTTTLVLVIRVSIVALRDCIRTWYYWPGMASEVHLWVAECAVCNQRKPSSASARAPMESIKVSQPMELWAMDILGPLPVTAQGHQYVLVMSDHFIKWVEAVPLANQKTVARAFVENVVARHGVPVKLLANQGTNFESELMKEVFQPNISLSSPNRRPRFNRTFKTIISSYVITMTRIYAYIWYYLPTVLVFIPRHTSLLSKRFTGERLLPHWATKTSHRPS